MRYRLFSVSSPLLLASVLAVVGLMLVVVDLVAGSAPATFESPAIVTFDTRQIRNSLQNSTFANASNTAAQLLPDWYSLHMTTVCSGNWTAATANNTVPRTKEKNNATTSCTKYGVAWNFHLGSVLIADADSALPSADLSPQQVADMNTALSQVDSVAYVNMTVPGGFFVVSLCLGFISFVCLFISTFKHVFTPLVTLTCVAGASLQFLSGILVLVGAAYTTAASKRLINSNGQQIGDFEIQAFRSDTFLALVWISVCLPFLAGGVGLWGARKEYREHREQPKMAPIKVPSWDAKTAGSKGSSTKSSVEKGARRSWGHPLGWAGV